MIEKISKRLTKSIETNIPNISSEKAEQIEYGIYMGISDISKLLAVLIIAAILGQFISALIIVIVFSFLKSYIGGVHAKTQIGCTIIYFTAVLGIAYLSNYLQFEFLNLISFILSIILAFIYAPADLPTKPIKSKSKREKMRTIGISSLFILFVITFFVPLTIKNVISLSALFSTINITPFIY